MSRCRNSSPDGRRGGLLIRVAGLLALLAGCHSHRDPQSNMKVALSDQPTDQRREALIAVAESREGDADWAVEGYTSIALLEQEPQVRCVAIRALAATGDPRAADTFLKIVEPASRPYTTIRVPDATTRWEALRALVDYLAADRVAAQWRPRLRTVLMDRLKNDSERQVRIAAAQGLGHFAGDVGAVEALINAQRDPDFAVVHASERSLIKLTGHTHDCSAPAWEAWLAANRDNLFADAGRVPPGTQDPSRSEENWRDTKRFFGWER